MKLNEYKTALVNATTPAEVYALETPNGPKHSLIAERLRMFRLSVTAGNPIYTIPDGSADHLFFALHTEFTHLMRRRLALCVEVKDGTAAATDQLRLHLAPAPGVPDGLYFINDSQLVAAVKYDDETGEVMEPDPFPTWENVVPNRSFMTAVDFNFIHPGNAVESVYISLDGSGGIAYYSGGELATHISTQFIAEGIPGGSGTLYLPFEYPAPIELESGPYRAIIMPMNDPNDRGTIKARKIDPCLKGTNARRNGFVNSLQSLAAVMCIYATDLQAMAQADQIAWLLENVEFPTPDAELVAGYYYTNSWRMADSLTVDLLSQSMEISRAIRTREDQLHANYASV